MVPRPRVRTEKLESQYILSLTLRDSIYLRNKCINQ